MTKQEQIEEMAKVIRPILENRTDICFIPDLDKPIAEELLKHYQPKLPKDSVVLSREEYELLANKYKNLEIKYSNLCDNYRLCKDANETLKQHIIVTCKETAEKIYTKIKDSFLINSNNRYALKLWIEEQLGLEIKE